MTNLRSDMSSERQRAARYGFVWQQVIVTRITEIERAAGITRVLRVNDLTIYVGPGGETRVFRNHSELKSREEFKWSASGSSATPAAGGVTTPAAAEPGATASTGTTP